VLYRGLGHALIHAGRETEALRLVRRIRQVAVQLGRMGSEIAHFLHGHLSARCDDANLTSPDADLHGLPVNALAHLTRCAGVVARHGSGNGEPLVSAAVVKDRCT